MARDYIPILIIEGSGDDDYCIQARRLLDNLSSGGRIYPDEYKALDLHSIWLEDGGYESSRKAVRSYCRGNHEKVRSVNIVKLGEYVSEGKWKYGYCCLEVGSEALISGLRHVLATGLSSRVDCFFHFALDSDDERFEVSHYLYYISLSYFEAMPDFVRNERNGKLEISESSRNENAFLQRIFLSCPCPDRNFTAKRVTGPIVNGVNGLSRIVPLFKLDWDLYRILSDAVRANFDIEKLCDVSAGNRSYIEEIQEGHRGELTQFSLLRMLVGEVCSANLKKAAKSRIEAGLLREEAMRMNGLSLLVFSVLVGYWFPGGSKDASSETDVREMLASLAVLADSVSDGVIQLVENALEHGGGGYLGIRVIRRDSKSFRERYACKGAPPARDFLEVTVDDYSGIRSLTKTFCEVTLEQDPRCSEDLKKRLRSLRVKDFFDPEEEAEELWREYYSIGENIASHYGLPVFASAVRSCHGYFAMASRGREEKAYETYEESSKEGAKGDETIPSPKLARESCLPGTHYLIVLPIAPIPSQKRTGIDSFPNYSDASLSEKWPCRDLPVLSERKQPFDRGDFKKWKDGAIVRHADRLAGSLEPKSVNVLSLSGYDDVVEVELLVKGLMCAMIRKASDIKGARVAIVDVPTSMMSLVVRLLASFYSRKGVFGYVESVQLFVSDGAQDSEVLFLNSLSESCIASRGLAEQKGVFNRCLDVMHAAESIRSGDGTPDATADYAPFDLIVQRGNLSLFEQQVRETLEREVQGLEFGCKVCGIHACSGSRVHTVDKFYEGSLLFSSNRYITRFACLIAQWVKQELSKAPERDEIVLVGYETYSELLVVEARNRLNAFGISCSHAIYEQGDKPRFKFLTGEKKSAYYFTVVPVGTTLTTNGEMLSELKIQHDVANEDVLANMVVVLTRNAESDTDGENPCDLRGMEREYWEKLDLENRMVECRHRKGMVVRFFVLTESRWENPLECSACFPEDLCAERPLTPLSQDNAAPMTLTGLREDFSSKKADQEDVDSPGDISLLRDCLLYGHRVRHNNHFLFYIRTSEVLKKIEQNEPASKEGRGGFSEWLDDIKRRIDADARDFDGYVYRILVAPMHGSNAPFVDHVHNAVFNGADLVLYVNSDKEFRDNATCKYSNVTALYENLLNAGRKARIDVFYVDDTIVSGATFNRTRSLVRSLFPRKAFGESEEVCVSVFKRVFLLVNRNSAASALSYVDSLDHFHTYIDLRIPSIRNHKENACVVCALRSEFSSIRDDSSTPLMVSYWGKRVDGIYAAKSVTIGSGDDALTEAEQAKYFRRLFASHHANKALDKLGTKRNDGAAVESALLCVMEKGMPDGPGTQNEMLISFIKVLSRAFLSYRKTVSEFVLRLCLQIASFVLFGDVLADEKKGFLVRHLESQRGSEDEKRLLSCALSAASNLNSSFLVRKRALTAIREKLPEDDFQIAYIGAVKKVTTVSGGSNRALWLEHLLLTGEEYGADYRISDIGSMLLGEGRELERTLFLENIKIARDAVKESYKRQHSKPGEKIDLSEYRFDSFRELSKMDIAILEKREEGCSGGLEEIAPSLSWLRKMVGLYECLLPSDRDSRGVDIESYYRKIVDGIKDLTGASFACLVNAYRQGGTDCQHSIATCKGEAFVAGRKDTVSWFVGDEACEVVPSLLFSETKNAYQIDLTSSTQSGSDGDRVLLHLKFEGGDRLRQLFRIRSVFTLLPEIRERVSEDLQCDAFRDNRELAMKNRLLSQSKAANHSTPEVLESLWDYLASSGKSLGEREAVTSGFALRLGADAIISKLYVAHLEYSGSKKPLYISYRKFEFDERYIGLLESIRYQGKLDSSGEYRSAAIALDLNARSFDYYFDGDNGFYLPYIIAAIVQNALRHGIASESGEKRIRVEIRLEGNCLVFENDASPSVGKRSGSKGITVTALKHYCEVALGLSSGFEQVLPTEDNGRHLIKLPIVKEG